MSENTMNPQPQEHEKVWALIPWFVNGRLSHEDSLAVETHLADCERCRDECTLQARIHDTIREDDSVAFAAEASYRKLASQIDASASTRARRDTRRMAGWLAAALAVESVALVAWGGWSWLRSPANPTIDARYITLSSPSHTVAAAQGQSQVRVMFTGQSTLDDVQGLLRSVDAHVVDGPTERGVYTLAWRADENATRLDTLRGSPLVRFAEPVVLDTGPAR